MLVSVTGAVVVPISAMSITGAVVVPVSAVSIVAIRIRAAAVRISAVSITIVIVRVIAEIVPIAPDPPPRNVQAADDDIISESAMTKTDTAKAATVQTATT